MSALLEQLNKVYFWDIDPDNLDEIASKNLIIERVMNYGNLREIQLVKKHYGDKEIIETVCRFRYIDAKTLHFLSLFFNIPKNRFKCYSEKPLINQHWSY